MWRRRACRGGGEEGAERRRRLCARAAWCLLAATSLWLGGALCFWRLIPYPHWEAHWCGGDATETGVPERGGGVLSLHYPPYEVLVPRTVVQRAPQFPVPLKRGPGLPPVSTSSVYIEREDFTAAMPIPGLPEDEKPSDVIGPDPTLWGDGPAPVFNLREPAAGCLSTHEARLRLRPVEEWTVEVTVLFSASMHFGHAIQTVRAHCPVRSACVLPGCSQLYRS